MKRVIIDIIVVVIDSAVIDVKYIKINMSLFKMPFVYIYIWNEILFKLIFYNILYSLNIFRIDMTDISYIYIYKMIYYLL